MERYSELAHIKSAQPDVELFPDQLSYREIQSLPQQQRQLIVEAMSQRRHAQAEAFSRMILMIGVCLTGGFALLLGLAVLASATRPAPPPAPVTVYRSNCILFCGGN